MHPRLLLRDEEGAPNSSAGYLPSACLYQEKLCANGYRENPSQPWIAFGTSQKPLALTLIGC